ncbi:MAG TPA: T9SS type A sorting domain-containing protein [Bacteroidia bacterium]|nr:T9SS type A sorting domain-containing protein [Bacteroidia bacterium]
MKKTTFILTFGAIALSALNTNSQLINTYAGKGVAGYSGNGGQATAAKLDNPCGMANDAAGNLYIADESSNTIRKISTAGIITTIAGIGLTAGVSGDGGPATAAELDSPQGVRVDSHGNVYIADWANGKVRKVNTLGIISTFAGSTPGFGGDGGPATAANLAATSDVAIDSLGNVYIADEGNKRVRVVNSSGIISTFAGIGVQSYSGDGGPATAAEIGQITGLITDANNNLYIADQTNNRIRMVNTSGIITTIAGNGVASYSGDGGQATAAELNFPGTVAIDNSGNLYIGDENNQRTRMINTSGIISTLAGNGIQSYSGDGGPATAAELNTPYGVSADNNGKVFIADLLNNRVRYVTVPITTGILNDVNSGANIILYPNPNNGSFTVSISNYELKIASIKVYNVLGERVYSTLQPLNIQGSLQINMDNQPAGIYIYSIADEKGVMIGTGRFIKE